jgi:hypothetical protein
MDFEAGVPIGLQKWCKFRRDFLRASGEEKAGLPNAYTWTEEELRKLSTAVWDYGNGTVPWEFRRKLSAGGTAAIAAEPLARHVGRGGVRPRWRLGSCCPGPGVRILPLAFFGVGHNSD